MTGKTYEANTDTCVAIEGCAFDGRSFLITHTTGTGHKLRIWVEISYADTLPAGALVVGDGSCDGYSADGQRIISVPASLCTFLTDEEAEALEEISAADGWLLSCARG